MKRSKFLKLAPREMPTDIPEDEVVAASQIVEADGEQAVEIDLFYGGELRARYFTDKLAHHTWIDGKWSSCRLENIKRLCEGADPVREYYYVCFEDIRWASEADERRVTEFLGESVWWSEVHQMRDSYRRAYVRKAERIRLELKDIPKVPDRMEQWADEVVFPGNILFFQVGERWTAYSCTACGGRGKRKKLWKHGEKTTCPKCGAEVTANRTRMRRERKEKVILLQKYSKKVTKKIGKTELAVEKLMWTERQFTATCVWEQGEKKDIRFCEDLRAVMPEGETWGKVYYNVGSEEEPEFWDKKGSCGKCFRKAFLYPDNLAEVLSCGGLERSGLDILARAGRKTSVNDFIITFRERPHLEYLIKAGLWKLTDDLLENTPWGMESNAIKEGGRSLRDALQLDGNRVNRMKQIDGGLNTMYWLQYEKEMEDAGHPMRITQESLEYLDQKGISMRSCETILRAMGSVNRMVNYMRRQKVKPDKLVTEWSDYLRMAEAEGMDASDDIVRFPKDLKLRHDQLVERINERKNEERFRKYDPQIRERLPEAARYYWQDDKYIIIPAGKRKELVQEGRALHHCVGASDQYMRKMAEGESWILFLRKKEDMETPWYTVEINMKDDHIIQYYSAFDRQPDREKVNGILERFRRGIKSRREQAKVAIA
ncbi:MAG: PcfJ domain-containing protein [Lachnospiraceae bacterium]|nr:PcfJ domain-containing protein [Lachnospiraceae bacterium]